MKHIVARTPSHLSSPDKANKPSRGESSLLSNLGRLKLIAEFSVRFQRFDKENLHF